jgi:cytochrome c oxidase assembly protein subunit 15
MFGKLIPPNLFDAFLNIVESPQTIVFIHRWFAFAVLAFAVYTYYIVRQTNHQSDLYDGLQWLIAAVSLQIILGIFTILSYVNIVVALLHQAGAIALFTLAIYFIHRFRAMDTREFISTSYNGN